MAVSAADRQAVASAEVPRTAEVRAALHQYLSQADLTLAEIADRVGYAHSTIRLFVCGRYRKVAGSDVYLGAAIWDFMQKNPLVPRGPSAKGRLFETSGYRQIRRYFLRAVEHGEVALLYGPPGVQKTFVLEHLICERNREGKNDAVYVYCSSGMTATALLKRIGHAARTRVAFIVRERLLDSVLLSLEKPVQRAAQPLTIIADEAQHLSVECLEVLRELHDRSGCGLVLAGSHDLFELFMRPERRHSLEQWLSRIDHKEQLPGLLEGEVLEIAARELGNGQPAKLTEKQQSVLLKGCRVEDIYVHGPDGKPAKRDYYSVRRLVKIISGEVEKLKERRGS